MHLYAMHHSGGLVLHGVAVLAVSEDEACCGAHTLGMRPLLSVDDMIWLWMIQRVHTTQRSIGREVQGAQGRARHDAEIRMPEHSTAQHTALGPLPWQPEAALCAPAAN